MMIALFPPNSNMVFPKRVETTELTWRPMAVEPVKEIRGKRPSCNIFSPTIDPRPITVEKIPEYPFFSMTVLQIFCTAMAHNGAVEDGFQIVVSPQIAAINAFHAQTATGKLNAEITPIAPKGCHCSYIR